MTLHRAIANALGRRARRAPRTELVAVWPDGRSYRIRKVRGLWQYNSQGDASSSLAGVRDALSQEGAALEHHAIS